MGFFGFKIGVFGCTRVHGPGPFVAGDKAPLALRCGLCSPGVYSRSRAFLGYMLSACVLL